MIHPEDRNKIWNDVQAAVNDKRMFQSAYRIITPEKKEKWGLGGKDRAFMTQEGTWSHWKALLPISPIIKKLKKREPGLKLSLRRPRRWNRWGGLPAGSAAEAVKLAGDCGDRIDLLLTDVVMPEMNGRELAAKLESLCPGIKTLFMSGYTANVIAHHGILDSGVYFIQKPFLMKDLSVKLKEALSRKN